MNFLTLRRPLADRFAARSADGLDQVVDQIMQAMD
jgi:hypothetical protein